MDCKYCFYEDEMANRIISSYGKMTEETLELLIKKALAHSEKECAFSFQGGEPTLIGIGFFKKAAVLQKKYKKNCHVIQNTIQTNGYGLNKEWAQFLKAENFLVGISLDGTPKVHNCYRKSQGDGTFLNVMQSVELLKKYDIPFHILTVVTRDTVNETERIYKFFKRNKLLYQQYIPCLEPLGKKLFQEPYSLTPELYAQFLKKLFDCWYDDMKQGTYVYIRYFENLAGMLKGFAPEHCGRMGVCGNQWVAEADGSLYPCDFYVLDQWVLGNIHDKSFDELEEIREKSGFVEESKPIPPDCKACKWYSICRNGCKRERDFVNGENINYYCSAYQDFFEYSINRLRELL